MTALVWLELPARGYIQNQRPAGQSMFRTDFGSIPYSVDSGTLPGQRNALGAYTITPQSDPLEAIRAAMESWSQISSSAVNFAAFKTSTGLGPRNDGVNVITFADTATTRSLVGDAVAVTFLYSRATGALTDTDILFNPRLLFSTEPDATSFDIQGTLAHELGHAIGLDHSGVAGATMFATTTQGTNRIKKLTSDEIAFARDVYPQTGPPLLGEVSGRVRFNAGTAVKGAHVVAVEPEQNLVVGAISGSDGSYRIGLLPPGRYSLYAEPLDGPAEEFQFGPTRRCPFNCPDRFRTTFLGGATPAVIVVTAGASAAADLPVESGEPSLNILGAGAAPHGLFIQNHLAAAVQPDGTFDVEVYGPGLDAAGISESTISFSDPRITAVPGTLKRGTAQFTDGSSYPELRFEIDVPADIAVGIASILVASATEKAAFTGGLVIIEPVPTPMFSSNGVTNAASFLSGPIAPGEIVSIFGVNLGPDEGLSGGLDESGRLVTLVGGVTVTFAGLPAPLFFVGSGQLNVQVPAFPSAGNVQVLVRRGEAVSLPVTLTLASTRPGLFLMPSSSSAIAINQDGSLNSAANPAPRGSTISLYGTGQGLTTPGLAAGQPAGVGDQLSLVDAPVTVTIGGQPATVSFAGMAPGFAGLLQVNAAVPGDASTGAQTPIELTIGGVATGQSAVIAVQ